MSLVLLWNFFYYTTVLFIIDLFLNDSVREFPLGYRRLLSMFIVYAWNLYVGGKVHYAVGLISSWTHYKSNILHIGAFWVITFGSHHSYTISLKSNRFCFSPHFLVQTKSKCCSYVTFIPGIY